MRVEKGNKRANKLDSPQTQIALPPFSPSPCFSIHSSACPSPRLLCLPPRSTVGFRSCSSQRRCKRGREDPEGRKDRNGRRTTGVIREGSARVCPTTGLEEAVSGLPLRGSLRESGHAFSSLLNCCYGNQAFQLSIWGRLSCEGERVVCAVAEMEGGCCF